MAEIIIPYKPRNWAKKLHDSYKRFFSLIIHRRGGKTTGLINHFQRCGLDDDRERERMRFLMPGISDKLLETLLLNRFYGIIYPTYKQAKLVAWEMMKHYSACVPGIKYNETELMVRYPNNARVQLFGADNPDALRGPAFWGLGFDEYSQQPANIFSEVLSKGLADHLGFAIFAGTIKGKNQLYRTNLIAKENHDDWDFVWQDVDYTLKTETDETLELIKRALADDRKLVQQGMMTEEEFQQEWYLSIEAAIKGSYYSKEITEARNKNRIKAVPYDPMLKVFPVWDLGVGQALGIGFYQKSGNETRMIDYWEGSNQDGIPQAVKALQNKPYVYGTFFLPHDAEAKSVDTGKTRVATLKELWPNIKIEIIPRMSVEDSIEKGRMFWSHLWIDEISCQIWLDYMSQYRQDWSEKRGMFIDKPYHDFTSHAADVHRYAALAEDKMSNEEKSGYKQKSYIPSSHFEGS